MNLIDTSQWGEFCIGELFEVERATRRTLNDYLDGSTPYVTNSVFNNGVSGYLQPKNKDDVEVGHCISVNSVDGRAFWQENDFLANSSGNGLILLRRDGLTEMQALFVCSAIEAVIEVRYAVMLTVQTLLATQVKLPVTSTGDPDWDAMGQTMREVSDRMATNLDALTALPADTTTGQIDIDGWGEFCIGDLFEVGSTARWYNTADFFDIRATPADGFSPYVVRSGLANGVKGWVRSDNVELNPGGTISFAQDSFFAFYQEHPYCTGNKIKVLTPLGPWLTANTAAFLVAAVNEAISMLDYTTGSTVAEISGYAIRLPVKSTGDPDWDAMEQTMREVTDRMTANLDVLEGLAM